ncbi:MAG: hypothetical protein ABEJ07_05475 [Candidatus Nanohaloarchaea archaeon]
METSLRSEGYEVLGESDHFWIEELPGSVNNHDMLEEMGGTFYTVVYDLTSFDEEELRERHADAVDLGHIFRRLEDEEEPHHLRSSDIDRMMAEMHRLPVLGRLDTAESFALRASSSGDHRYVPAMVTEGRPHDLVYQGPSEYTIAGEPQPAEEWR